MTMNGAILIEYSISFYIWRVTELCKISSSVQSIGNYQATVTITMAPRSDRRQLCQKSAELLVEK